MAQPLSATYIRQSKSLSRSKDGSGWGKSPV